MKIFLLLIVQFLPNFSLKDTIKFPGDTLYLHNIAHLGEETISTDRQYSKETYDSFLLRIYQYMPELLSSPTYPKNAQIPPNTLYEGHDIFISKAFPNPAGNLATIKYNLKTDRRDAKIILHNVLGSKVAEFKLLHYETELSISTRNLSPGVYFYTLYLDSENIITHKLIVKR
jgi:hypothetical protein